MKVWMQQIKQCLVGCHQLFLRTMEVDTEERTGALSCISQHLATFYFITARKLCDTTQLKFVGWDHLCNARWLE